ncbi:MAG: hypothetical protein OEM43_00395 [Gammaproteobacteria bacterium]|nr:hypothetical protein [Gammaproteobacteria bacterium]
MRQYDPWETGSRTRLRDDFLNGMRCYEKRDLKGALNLFRAADEYAEMDDIYQNRYTSFHGLVRVFMGDASGVKLCRKAAVGEQVDVEVYYNLAMAEYKLDFRGGAYMALRRGLRIDAKHPGLRRLLKEFNLRARHPVLPWLSRDNVFNRKLGKLFRKRRKSRPGGS